MERTVPVLCAIALLTGACSRSASSQAPLALTNVTVIDGTGAAPRPGMTVVVERGRIAAIFPAGSQSLPPGAVDLGVAGSFVIPGLIDAHVHLATFERPDDMRAEILRNALLGGVTTVRDMGGNVEIVMAQARAAEPADALSPRIVASAVFAGPRWFAEYDPARIAYWSGSAAPGTAPGVRQIDASTDMAAAVRAAAALGVRGIKVYSDIPSDRLVELGRLTREAGLALWSHAVVPPSRPDDVVAAGMTSISHADQLIWTASAPGAPTIGDRAERARLIASVPPDGPVMAAVFAQMIRTGTLLEPTLIVMQVGDLVDGRIGPLGAVQGWAVGAAAAAHRAGVGIVAGSDAIGTHTPTLHTELQLLVRQVGMTPLEAIQAATQHGARALGLADSTGTVTTGKWADLVVLRADPSADIRNTQTVTHVFRGGVLHVRTVAWRPPPGAELPPS